MLLKHAVAFSKSAGERCKTPIAFEALNVFDHALEPLRYTIGT